jgi:glycolate oxidase FAD binding subunit
MTTVRPTSTSELAAVVPSRPQWQVRAGGTKPALSSALAGVPVLDASRLAGIVEYTPEECTFTALAGTRIVDIERALAPHGQYLPFDPPLAAAGATLGGTVAAGVNGPCRYRFGGIRDFLIGACIIDGEGRILQAGGKVVKNAAGFLLHQAMVGSCGTLGVLAELTFKVFPAAEARATMRVEARDLDAALDVMAAVQRERFDLEAIDLAPPGTLWLRLGGFAEGIATRVEALRRVVGTRAIVLTGDDEAAVWRDAREFGWAPPGGSMVRVPITLPRLRGFDDAVAGAGGERRYSVAGSLAWVSWPDPVEGLDAILRDLGVVGQVLTGPAGRPYLGAVAANAFEERLRGVMDPQGRFRATSHPS